MTDAAKQTYKGYLSKHFAIPAAATLPFAVGAAINKYSATHDFFQAAGIGLAGVVMAAAVTLGMTYAMYKRDQKPD